LVIALRAQLDAKMKFRFAKKGGMRKAGRGPTPSKKNKQLLAQQALLILGPELLLAQDAAIVRAMCLSLPTPISHHATDWLHGSHSQGWNCTDRVYHLKAKSLNEYSRYSFKASRKNGSWKPNSHLLENGKNLQPGKTCDLCSMAE
jgi:hypothetical protein